MSKQAISSELEQLKQVKELATSCRCCVKHGIKCEHEQSTLTFCGKLKDMTRKRTLKPLILILFLFFVMQFCAMNLMRPYLVPILNAYGIPLETNLMTVILGSLGLLAKFFTMASITTCGKRNLFLYSTVGYFMGCFGLSRFIKI